MNKKKVLIIDDSEAMRETLKVLLAQGTNIEVIGEAVNGREGLEMAKMLQPDLVIVDIAMPVMNGIEATRMIREILPDTRIIGLTMYSNRHFSDSMMEAGADAMVSKDMLFQEILFAIGSDDSKAAPSPQSKMHLSIGR